MNIITKRQIFKLVGGAFIALMVFALYFPGFNGPTLVDDPPNLGVLHALVKAPTWHNFVDIVISNESGPTHRPVAMFTFAVQTLLVGDSSWWQKCGNLIVHLLCGWALYHFTLLLLTRLGTTHRQMPALIATLFWLLIPMQVSTVLYAVQRMAQLSTLFTLLSLTGYLRWRITLSQGELQWRPLVTTAVMAILAVFSKENALLLPFFIMLLEWLILTPTETRTPLIPYLKRGNALLLLLFISTFTLILALKPSILINYSTRDFSLTERLLSEARVVADYLRQIFFPDIARLGVFHDDFQKSTGWLTPVSTLFSFIILLTLVIFALMVRHRQPLLAFGILFFFVAHLMESTIISLELYFEHRNYLASMGAAWLLSSFYLSAEHRKSHLGIWIFTPYLMILSLETELKVQDFSSLDRLLQTSFSAHPHSHRLLTALTGNAANDRRYAEATRYNNLLLQEKNSFRAASFMQAFALHCMQKQDIPPTMFREFSQSLHEQGHSAAALTFALDTYNDIIRQQKCHLNGYKATALQLYVWENEVRSTHTRAEVSGLWTTREYIAYALGEQGYLTREEELLRDIWNPNHDIGIVGLTLAKLEYQLGDVTRADLTLKQLQQMSDPIPAFARQEMDQLEKDIHETQRHFTGKK